MDRYWIASEVALENVFQLVRSELEDVRESIENYPEEAGPRSQEEALVGLHNALADALNEWRGYSRDWR